MFYVCLRCRPAYTTVMHLGVHGANCFMNPDTKMRVALNIDNVLTALERQWNI